MKFITKLFSKAKFKVTLFFLRVLDDLIICYQKLRPSTHIARLRIRELNQGQIDQGDNVCIFIIYERMRIPKMTWDAIHAINEMGIKIFLVVNSKLTEHEMGKVREVAEISMFRNNTGKDIGGYKDAFLFLEKRGDLSKINRLIFANDSVVYPQKFIKPIFDQLIGKEAGFVGYSHVQEIHYHVQSFLFSCDNALINDKLFVKFWKKYLPIDRRRYMIHKGEVGITKTVIKTGRDIAIINTIADLLSHDFSLKTLSEITYSLPTNPLRNLAIEENLQAVSEKVSLITTDALKQIRLEVESEKLEEILISIENYRKLLRANYVRELVSKIGFRNSTHWSTFIFLELGAPVIIKRDAVYRAGFDFDYFLHYIKKYFGPESEEIMTMIKSPSASHFKGLKKIMFQDGII